MTARLFELVRHVDVSGVSGTGVVAEGIEYADGGIALRWKGEWPATAVWPNMAALLAIHGHDGKTVARYVGNPEAVDTADVFVREIRTGRHFIVAHRYERDGRIEMQCAGVDEWRGWVGIFGGSIDAATVHERSSVDVPWEWSWIAPDNSVHVYYITANRDEVKLEAG